MAKKLSRQFRRTKSWSQGILSKLKEFVLSWHFRVQIVTVPETSCNYDKENQEYNEDRSQNDPHPEVATSVNRSPFSVNSDPDPVLHIRRTQSFVDISGFLLALWRCKQAPVCKI